MAGSYGKKRKTVSRRLTVKPRFFVQLAVLILLITGIVLFLTLREKSAVVTTASLTQTVQTDAVILRDETVVAAEQTGQIEALVSEGDEVKKNEDVVLVYSAQASASSAGELYELRDRIVAYQKSAILGDILDSDLAALDAQIEEKTRLVAQSVRSGDAAAVKTQEAELSALLSDRADYLRRNYRVDETLSGLLAQEEALQKQLEDSTTQIKAPFAGRVSFSVDGCEHLLNAGVLEQLTAAELKSAVAHASMQRVTQATQYTSLFRIVKTEGWYCVFPTDSSLEIVPGQRYTIALSGQRYEAAALSNETYAQNGLTVLYVQGDPSALLNARSVKLTIEKSFEGMCVPKRALTKRQGQTGVYVLSGGAKTFVAVTPLAREGANVVVQSDGLSLRDTVAL